MIERHGITAQLRRLGAKLTRPVMVALAIAGLATPALAAEPATGDRLEVTDLAGACTHDAVQRVADTLPTKVSIAAIANGPKFEGGTKYVAATAKRQAYCQITGSFVTNARTGKTANFLATLPTAWNRKYLQFGCFGHCGFFSLNDASSPLATIVAQGYPGQILEKGYASFGTDEGHEGGSGGEWAVKGPGRVDKDAIDDFLYRADKQLAQTGKALTAAFYSQATASKQRIAFAYFCGCSGGGRDAMVAASYFPEEFDGIVAGSPYFNMANIGFQVVGTYLATLRSAGADLPPALIATIDPIVKAQCDAIDGVKDGLIQNPAACNFRPQRDLPRCAGDTPGPACFTKAQIETVSALLTAVTDEEGKLVQPAYSASEVLPFFREGQRPADINASVPWDVTGGSQSGLAPLGDAVLRVFTHGNDPKMTTRSLFSFGAGGTGPVTDYRVIVPAAEVAKAREAVKLGIGDTPDKLARLIGSKSKLLIWHNLSDEKLTPYMAINYYKTLAKRYGGYEKLSKAVRLFLLPGTSHCSMSGEGPSNFDPISAIEEWAEKGHAPDSLVATVYNPTSPMVDRSKPALRSMPLCAFPAMARYSGKGDVKLAANWSCPAGDASMLKVGETGRQGGIID
jgi:feruloyl esterase